jgi:hypothetical protein
MGQSRREGCQSGDPNVRARTGGWTRGGQDDDRQPDVAQDQAHQAARKRRDEAPQSDREQEKRVQAVEYRPCRSACVA